MQLGYQRLFLLLFALVLPGCGSKGPVEPDLDLVPVSGVITLDGKPLADANITLIFEGKPPKGFMASGAKSDSDGNFVVKTGSKEGTVAGKYKISVSLLRMPDGSPVKEEPGMDAAMMEQGGQVKDAIPERYRDPEITELSATVPADGLDNLELKLSGS